MGSPILLRGSNGFTEICGFVFRLSFELGPTQTSLDPLPFPTESFEFVRIHSVGLGVPEDKVCCVHSACCGVSHVPFAVAGLA